MKCNEGGGSSDLPGADMTDAWDGGSTLSANQFEGVDAQFDDVVDPSPEGGHRIRHHKQKNISELDVQLQIVLVHALSEQINAKKLTVKHYIVIKILKIQNFRSKFVQILVF